MGSNPARCANKIKDLIEIKSLLSSAYPQTAPTRALRSRAPDTRGGFTGIRHGALSSLPYSRALQGRHACLFVRQAARQIPYRHIAPSRPTSPRGRGRVLRYPYASALPVLTSSQRPTDVPSPRMNAALIDDCRARGATVDDDGLRCVWIAMHA